MSYNDINAKFGIFLNQFRKKRKISIAELATDICEERHMYRYFSGEVKIPLDVVNELSKKLEIDLIDLYFNFILEEKNDLLSMINQIDYAISTRDYVKAKELVRNVESNFQGVDETSILVPYYRTLFDYREKKIDQKLAKEAFIRFADYPKCLKKKYYSIYEINILNQIATIFSDEKKYDKAIQIWKSIIDNNLATSNSQNTRVFPKIIYNLGRSMAIQKEYEQSVVYLEKGISHSKSILSYDCLGSLHYMYALVLRRLDKNDEALIQAKLAFPALKVESSPESYAHYVKDFEKTFEMSFKEVFDIGF